MRSSMRAANLAIQVLYITFVLLCFSCFNNEVVAWQSGRSSRMVTTRTTMTTTRRAHEHPSNEDEKLLEPSSSARRKLLFGIIPKKIGAAVAATATTVLVVPHSHSSCNANAAASAGGGLTADAARDQWKESVTTIDNLLQNWSTVSEGDAGPNNIRKTLGFLGATSSPLYQIEKAFKVLRDSDEYVEDGIEFFETAEEFVVVWVRADSLADSANLKTGSGKQTPPEVFIENSKTQVLELQRIAKKMNSMLLK